MYWIFYVVQVTSFFVGGAASSSLLSRMRFLRMAISFTNVLGYCMGGRA